MERKEHLYFVGYVNSYGYNGKKCGDLKKLKTELPMITSGYIAKENKISISKRFLGFYVHCRIMHN